MGARDPRQAEYERRSRQRRDIRAAAAFNGWVDLPVLAAFIDPDTEAFMLFDQSGTRYLSEPDAPRPMPVIEQAADTLVAPADVPSHELGPRWQNAREKFAAVLAALDLSETSRSDALKTLEAQAAVLLRAVQVLREHDGPDWREQIGLGA